MPRQILCSLLAALFIAPTWAQESDAGRPNFLLIVTDDMDYTDINQP